MPVHLLWVRPSQLYLHWSLRWCLRACTNPAEPHSLCLRWDPTRLGRSPSLRNLHVCHKSDEGIFKSKSKGKIQTILYNVYGSYVFCFMAAFSAIAGFSMQPLSSRMSWVHTGGNRPHFRAGSRLLGILKVSKYSSAQTASLVNLYIFTKQSATKYSSLAL